MGILARGHLSLWMFHQGDILASGHYVTGTFQGDISNLWTFGYGYIKAPGCFSSKIFWYHGGFGTGSIIKAERQNIPIENTLISLISMEVGMNVEGVQKLPNH